MITSIMQNAAIVLSLAALGGVVMVLIRLSGKPYPPTWLAIGHGLIAATGLGLLIYAASTSDIPQRAQVALGLFVLAAIGGTTMFLGFHQRNRPLPIPLMLGHGLLALSGVALLWMNL